MSHLQYTAKSHHLKWNVRQLSPICHHFYQNYCPDSLLIVKNCTGQIISQSWKKRIEFVGCC